MNVCDNPRCRHSSVQTTSRECTVRVKVGREEYEVRRYLYRNNYRKEFWFCETCHTAIETLRRA